MENELEKQLRAAIAERNLWKRQYEELAEVYTEARKIWESVGPSPLIAHHAAERTKEGLL